MPGRRGGCGRSGGWRAVDAGAGGAGGGWLAEHAAKDLLRTAGVPVPAGRVVSCPDDAVATWRELGGPVALKLSAAAVQHTSDLGGVALGLDDEAAVRDAHRRLAPLAAAHGGALLAERMAPPGVELIVAAHTDGVVPALVLGLGGIWAELLADVAVVPLPASATRIERALRGLRAAPLLFGGRGAGGVDVAGVIAVARGVGELLVAHRLAIVECNPVIAGPGFAVAVDAAARTAGRDA